MVPSKHKRTILCQIGSEEHGGLACGERECQLAIHSSPWPRTNGGQDPSARETDSCEIYWLTETTKRDPSLHVRALRHVGEVLAIDAVRVVRSQSRQKSADVQELTTTHSVSIVPGRSELQRILYGPRAIAQDCMREWTAALLSVRAMDR